MARRWSDREERHLRSHADDGAAAIAAELGRTETAVRLKAMRLGVALAPRWQRGLTCPRCGHRMTRSMVGWRAAGVCDACWERIKADALRERTREELARREYQIARDERRGMRRG